MNINAVEFVMECVVPATGVMLTAILIRVVGLQSGWWLLLALPGALIFQWAVTLGLVGIASLVDRGSPPGDG
jgi:hypothetical protein